MLGLVVVAVVGAWPLQDARPKAAPESVAEQAAAFQSAVDEKRFDEALRKASGLVARYVELGRLIGPATPTKEPSKEPSSGDTPATAKADRKRIADVLEKSIKAPRLPAEFQQKILAQLDVRTEDGDVLLARALPLEHVHDATATFAAAIKALGTYRRTQYVDVFEKIVAADRRAEVMNAAASALGEYFGEKEATRKQIVDSLLRAYSSIASSFAGSGPNSAPASGDLVLQVRHDFQWALARLTGGVHFDRAKQWTEWWRDAKSAPWSAGVDRPNVKLDNVETGPAPTSKPGGH